MESKVEKFKGLEFKTFEDFVAGTNRLFESKGYVLMSWKMDADRSVIALFAHDPRIKVQCE